MARALAERYDKDMRGKAAEIKGLADRVNELLAERDEERRLRIEAERRVKALKGRPGRV